LARELSYTQAIQEALAIAMRLDPRVICYGLGVDDPMRIFGTTSGLQEEFGRDRVFDMPSSENAMTGIGIGAALNGMLPVMVHQRFDFFLLALDQLINNAAKWHYMFSGHGSAGITLRLIVGQGWGQGPTHSQSLHSWFAHIPGLKVVIPTTPRDAKGLLLSAIFDPNPVVVIEHRWLHNTAGEVPEQAYRIPIGKADSLASGDDMTIVSTSYLSIEALRAVRHMQSQGVNCDLIDLRSVNPIDWSMIHSSVRKTGRLLVMDAAHHTGSVAAEIIANVSEHCFSDLRQPPSRLTYPDYPSPSSPALTRDYYPRAEEIIDRVAGMLGTTLETKSLSDQRKVPHDIPGEWFKGPF